METVKELILNGLQEHGCKDFRYDATGEGLQSDCPFHQTKSGRPFNINLRTGLYMCWNGQCGARGNLYTFLTQVCGFSRLRALIVWGAIKHEVEEVSDEAIDEALDTEYEKRKIEPLVEVTEGMAEERLDEMQSSYYRNRSTAYNYFEARLGRFDPTLQFHLERLRIGFTHEWGGRVTIPLIEEQNHRVIGFTYRGTSPEQEPKYVHRYFERRQEVYSNLLWRNDRNKQDLWITEGNLDCLALGMFGSSGVATMGSRVTEQQIDTIVRKYKPGRRFILAFDTDKEGRDATHKAAEWLSARIWPTEVTVFDNHLHDMFELIETGFNAGLLDNHILDYPTWFFQQAQIEKYGNVVPESGITGSNRGTVHRFRIKRKK